MTKTCIVVAVICIVYSFVNGCVRDNDCPTCPAPKDPHCHSDGICYCDIPTECEGAKDKKSCKNVTCPCTSANCTNGDQASVCYQESAHWHCVCL